VLWVHHFGLLHLHPITQMSRFFGKKREKSQHIPLGIPTNVAAGPLGFRADLGISPKGERGRFNRNLGTDRLDSPVTLGEKDTATSRIVFHDKKSEDQHPPALQASTPSTVVGGTGYGNDPPSKCFQLPTGADVHVDLDPLNIRRGPCWRGRRRTVRGVERCVSKQLSGRLVLTSTSCEQKLDTRRPRGCRHCPRSRGRGRRGIRSSQSRPRRYLHNIFSLRSSFTAAFSKFLPDNLPAENCHRPE